jgi:hypothetical protein
MNSTFLGETELKIEETKYKDFTTNDWIKFWLFNYNFDGNHHKQWLLDQILRLSTGSKVNIKLAKWSDGTQEERFTLDVETPEYTEWINNYKNGEDGPDTYEYDNGIAP